MSWLKRPRQLIVNIRLWHFRHELMNFSGVKPLRHVPISREWSNDRLDEVRVKATRRGNWQRKCVKRVFRDSGHIPTTLRYKTSTRTSTRRDLQKFSILALAGLLLSRNSFDVDISNPARLACIADTLYLARNIFWKIWYKNRVLFPMLCFQIYLHMYYRFFGSIDFTKFQSHV